MEYGLRGFGAGETPRTVATATDLPSEGKYNGETYMVLDVDEFRSWDDTTAAWVEPGSLTPVQNAGNPNGVVTGRLGRYCRDTTGLVNYICVDYPSGTHWDVI